MVKLPESFFKPGHNTPPHLFVDGWFYMLTGATYQRQPILHNDKRKEEWSHAFLTAASLYGWLVVAWVVLDNHYHAIVKSPERGSQNLSRFVASYHKFTARRWNAEDHQPGRMVWWNYWDTCIRSQEDYLNRLRYIFWNPVKHGVADDPLAYPYSNYAEFLRREGFEISPPILEVDNVPEF